MHENHPTLEVDREDSQGITKEERSIIMKEVLLRAGRCQSELAFANEAF